MKRYLVILLTLCSLLAAGCTTTTNQPTSQPVQENQQQAKDKAQTAPDTPSEETTKEAPIAKLPTIGDSQRDWEKEWGHPYNQGDTLRVFHDGRYEVVFQNGRAVTVTLKNKAGEDINLPDFLPTDAQKQTASAKVVGGLMMKVEKWHSKMLEKNLSTTKGNFTVMKQGDSIIIDCTPNLKK